MLVEHLLFYKGFPHFWQQKLASFFINAQITERPADQCWGHSLTACNAALLAKSKMATRGPQMGRRGLESCLPLDFWALQATFAK